MKQNKMSLTEATMLALQGKLKLEESVDVSIDNNIVVVDTEDANIIIEQPAEVCEEECAVTDEASEELLVEEVTVDEVVEEPVEEVTESKLNEEVNILSEQQLKEEAESPEFRYQLLSRLQSDCKYFLGNGGRSDKCLWAGNVQDQIAKMKELYNSFSDDMKPEWLTMEDIENYEKEMTTEKTTESKLEETGEWDDNDDEMKTWLEDMRIAAEELAKQVGGEVSSVTGFDKYIGPCGNVKTPNHGLVELYFDGEDDTGRTFIITNIKGGFLRGDINQLATILNKEEIDDAEVITENKKVEETKEVITEEKESLEEDYAEKLGGNPEDFVGDMKYLLSGLQDINTEAFATKLPLEMIEEWIEVCKNQIERGKRLASGDEFATSEVEESKGIKEETLQFKGSTFNTVVENYLKELDESVESFNITSLQQNDTSLKLEGNVSCKDNNNQEICLEMNKVRQGSKFTKYQICEAKGLKLESNSKSTNTYLTTVLNKDNILECKYYCIK